MKTSRQGAALIAQVEAVSLVAYQDGPHYAIGVGHNSAAVHAGDEITLDEAFRLLAADLAAWEAVVAAKVKVGLEQHEFDALVSLAFNRGNRGLGPVAAALNKGNVATAMAALVADPMRARLGRRMRERALFLTGQYGDVSHVPVYTSNPRWFCDGVLRRSRPKAMAITQWLDLGTWGKAA